MLIIETLISTYWNFRWEAAQIPNEADDGGRGQKSDAGNGEKSLHLRKLLGERLELVLDASALVLELSNLGARITQVRTEHGRANQNQRLRRARSVGDGARRGCAGART